MADLNRIPGVKSRIARTYRRLRDIAVWQAFWPFFTVCTVFLCLALLGLHERLPTKLAAFSTFAFLILALITVLRGVRHYKRPHHSDALRELDRQSDLRPLNSLQDRPTRPDAEGVMLWRAHEQRLTDAIRRLNVPSFRGIWRRIDPFMFRAILPAAIVSLLVANGTGSLDRLSKAFNPDYGSLLGAENIQIEAWITPPDYTGRAPIFLDRDQRALEVPVGSIITVRAQAPSAPKLRLVGQDRKTLAFAATPDGAFETVVKLVGDTDLSVRWWGERQSWSINASPDTAPKALFVSMPTLGKTDETEFTWAVEDDYGVAKLELAIRPEDDPTREPDLIPIELGALNPTDLTKRDSVDLTRNRWAGASSSLATP